jgi:membrane protease subunit HflC
MKSNPLTLGIGILLLAIFGLLLFSFQVRKSEVAVVTLFGKPVRDIGQPGAYGRLPWPIQKVYKFDQRTQNFEDKFTEGITQDNFNLLTSVYVGWKITEPKVFFPKFAGSSEPMLEAERGIERLLSSVKIAVVGKHPLGDFISPSSESHKFVEIEKEILDSLRTELRNYNYGLDVQFLGIKRLGLPENVTQSVFERMTAERKLLAEKLQSEGEAEAQTIRSDAERRAAELLASAEGQAIQIRGKGEAEAAKSLAVFKQDPGLASLIFRLNALEGALKDRSILVFDQTTPPFDVFRGSLTNLVNQRN